MTKTLQMNPARLQTALICVWIATRNPARPLECRWISGEAAEGSSPPDAADAALFLMCA